jgi:hypothetical protein
LRAELNDMPQPGVGLPPAPYEVETPVGINVIRA